MKRYLVLSGMDYYPGGGWNDFDDSFDNLGEAIRYAAKRRKDWVHIVDTQTSRIVERFYRDLT